MARDELYDRSLPEPAPLDRAFADFICRLAGTDSQPLWLAAALVSSVAGKGSVCVDLPLMAGEPAAFIAKGAALADGAESPWRDAAAWSAELRRHLPVTSPGGFAPLVLDGRDRLYMHRYWSYERDLAEALLERVASVRGDLDEGLLSAGLDRFFPLRSPDAAPDLQRLAACLAVSRSLAVIAGGPGTGKTTTVVRVLALLLEQSKDRPLRIALAAPTGKAASRLREAIMTARGQLPLAPELSLLIPSEAVTLHRLLGTIHGSVSFRHNRDNPLPFDVVVVDEASMIDLPLMARLTAALSPGSRLILLGDRDQLASVEAGAVLGDICNPAWLDHFSPVCHSLFSRVGGITLGSTPLSGAPSLCDAVVNLKTSHRFGPTSGIAQVSRLVNEGLGGEALSLMREGTYADISWHDLPSPGDILPMLKERLVEGYGGFLAEDDPTACLAMFGRFRILCPLRQGPFGVVSVNAAAERTLGLGGHHSGALSWYRHRPVLVTGNDYQLGLSNGDIGVALPGESREGLSVWFPAADGAVRRISPLRLSSCETVFAMTVHKSQGSEFDSLLLLLPDGAPELLTRELIYTAITRARKRVVIWGSEAAFIAAVSRQVLRSSGLRERLWGEEQ